jgi:hypothetical protein
MMFPLDEAAKKPSLQIALEADQVEQEMIKKDQLEELEELKTRVDALERAVAVVIDVLKDEMDKTDAYGLFKRLRKWSALPAMKETLDGAKKLVSSGK